MDKAFTAEQIKEHLKSGQEIIVLPDDLNTFATVYHMWAGSVLSYSPFCRDDVVDDPEDVDELCEEICNSQSEGRKVYVRGEAL